VPLNTVRRRVNGSMEVYCQRPGPKTELRVELENELYEGVKDLHKIRHETSR
jgi:hypothetical protein